MERVSTGILGLDEMLGGGFPRDRVILVRGGPGSGKTVFSLQFVVEGVKRGERGIYVTLEEPLSLIQANVASFGWNLEDFEKKGLLRLVDGSQLVYRSAGHGRAQLGDGDSRPMIASVASQIRELVKSIGAKRLAVDPITSAIIHQRFPTDKRLEILELVKVLRNSHCTSIITSEFSSPSAEGDFYVEEYLADGVIILSKTLRDFRLIKTVRVEKMRGARHDDQPRKYDITGSGLVVYNTEAVTVL